MTSGVIRSCAVLAFWWLFAADAAGPPDFRLTKWEADLFAFQRDISRHDVERAVRFALRTGLPSGEAWDKEAKLPRNFFGRRGLEFTRVWIAPEWLLPFNRGIDAYFADVQLGVHLVRERMALPQSLIALGAGGAVVEVRTATGTKVNFQKVAAMVIPDPFRLTRNPLVTVTTARRVYAEIAWEYAQLIDEVVRRKLFPTSYGPVGAVAIRGKPIGSLLSEWSPTLRYSLVMSGDVDVPFAGGFSRLHLLPKEETFFPGDPAWTRGILNNFRWNIWHHEYRWGIEEREHTPISWLPKRPPRGSVSWGAPPRNIAADLRE